MILEIIKKELCTQFGAELPVYRSKLENPIIFIWNGEKAIQCPHKQAFGIECEFEEEIQMPFEHLVNELKNDIPELLDKAYVEARDRLDAKVNYAIQCLSKTVDEAKPVLSGQENHVRLVQFIRLHPTFFASANGCIMYEIHAFIAEVY